MYGSKSMDPMKWWELIGTQPKLFLLQLSQHSEFQRYDGMSHRPIAWLVEAGRAFRTPHLSLLWYSECFCSSSDPAARRFGGGCLGRSCEGPFMTWSNRIWRPPGSNHFYPVDSAWLNIGCQGLHPCGSLGDYAIQATKNGAECSMA